MAKRTNDILKKRKKHRVGRIIFRIFLLFVLICTVMGGLAAAGLYYYISRDLPKISSLKDYHPPIISTVYADDGRKIGEFFNERRIVVPLADMPDMLIKAFVGAEDSRFYTHQGIDLLSITRAFIKNIEAGSIVQGGSTITQQVTKSFLLTPEKSYTRKMKEAILAYRIEKALSKGDILYLYLNQIYLGHGAYGVEAAAENYFGKTARDMNLAECAMLAGLPQAPSRYSPFRYPDRAKQRRGLHHQH
jgi:penicillin-binding protein 1A